MRPVTLADLETAQRVVKMAPVAARAGVARQLLKQAEVADAHRLRTGDLHPDFGSGTLQSAAQGWPMAPRAAAFDQEALAVFMLLLSQIVDFLTHHQD